MPVKHWFIILFGVLMTGLLPAQNCTSILNEAKSAYRNKNFRLAFNKLQDTETCDYKNVLLKERQALQNDIFNAIDEQRKEAERNAQVAKESTQKVLASEAETQMALRQAQQALDSLKIVLQNLDNANADKVRLILAEVARNQKELNFDAAIDKIKTAKLLRALPDSVTLAYQNLSRLLLAHAHKNIQAGAYQSASKKIKGAGELNVRPDSVRIAEQELQHVLFENVELDLKNSDYDTALAKISILKKLRVPSDTIESLWFEIAFCFTETSRIQKAEALLDSIAQARHDNGLINLLQNQPVQKTQGLRQMLQQIDPTRMNAVENRYFSKRFISIPEGTYIAGSGPGGNASSTTCSITVRPFTLAAYEVTFYEYDLFCNATNRPKPLDRDWGRGSQPVINANWLDAVEYCNWRSKRDGLTDVYQFTSADNITCNWSATGYRLPRETEWEYAAGNGTAHTRFSWGNDFPTTTNGGNVADETVKSKFPDWQVFAGYSDGFTYTAPVGSYPANQFGLYDMTGNVWEWCWEIYHENYCEPGNPKDDVSLKPDRMLRGGSWGSFPRDCEITNRFHNNPVTRNFSTGFRLAKNQP